MQGSMWWVVPRHVVAFLPSVAHPGPDQSDEAIHSERNWAKMLRKVEGVPGCGLDLNMLASCLFIAESESFAVSALALERRPLAL